MKLVHLRHSEIDKQRWDAAIAASSNCLPYAFAWFLDAVSPGWEALVSDDYVFVMPLTVKRKWCFKYVIQPRWTQQLGVFSAQPVTSDILQAFLRRIPYLSYDFNVNYGNVLQKNRLVNLLLDLNLTYESLSKTLSENTRRNIAKSARYDLQIREISRCELVDFWRQHAVVRNAELSDRLERLSLAVEANGTGKFRGVFASDRLIAALMTLECGNRIVYLVPVSNAEGKQKSAMFLMVDHLLRTYAGSGMIFDFEGSRIEGVARFYRGFGACEQSYFSVNRCRPQWLVKLINS